MDFDVSKNYYDILWVSEDASAEEIKKAFKKAAVKHHPDKQWGDKKKFQDANEAYQVIGDEKKKSQYDAYRKGGGWFGGFGGGGQEGGFGGFSGGDFWGFDIGDLMGGIFGGGFGGGNKSRAHAGGDDITLGINITFEESFLWVEKKISYQRMKKIAWATEKTCDTCNGHGQVAQNIQTPFGTMQSQAACRACGGVGRTYTKDGRTLGAGGLEEAKEIVDIKIPSGIREGAYIRFTGKGNDPVGNGKAGDLYIQVQISGSKVWERKGENLYVKTTVSLFDLVLGGECSVDHPEGKLKIKVPKGTQVGDMIKISGKGFGEWGVFSRKGDLYVIPKVEIPKKLSKEQEKLWSELKWKK